MAKSIRSKWRRKCRAIKRERYGAKELERLKKTLGINEDGSKEVEMPEISEIATVVDAKTVKENAKTKEGAANKMDVDTEVRVYSKQTMRDQYGNYPAWMSKRKIQRHKKGRSRSQKGSVKSHKRLTRRQKKGGQKK